MKLIFLLPDLNVAARLEMDGHDDNCLSYYSYRCP